MLFFHFFHIFSVFTVSAGFPPALPFIYIIVVTIYTYTERQEQGFRKAYPLRSPCSLSILVQCFISSMRMRIYV